MASNVVGTVATKLQLRSCKVNFGWLINNFSYVLKDMREVESPKFTEHRFNREIQWHMKLNLSNCRETLNEDFSLMLYATAKIEVEECSFLVLGDCITAFKILEKPCFNETQGYYYTRVTLTPTNYELRSVCPDAVRIPDKDSIMIAVSMDITFSPKQREELEQQRVGDLSRLEEIAKYEALLNDEKFSDVSLIAEGKTLKVHKCILAKSSSVFSAMFDAEMKEKRDNIVEIDDISYDVLKEMVRFIYTGKFSSIDTLMVGELATAAEKYDLDGLKNTCGKLIARRLSSDNVIDGFQLADKLRMDELKEKTVEFMVENARNITMKPEFKSLPLDIVCKICCCLAQKYQ